MKKEHTFLKKARDWEQDHLAGKDTCSQPKPDYLSSLLNKGRLTLKSYPEPYTHTYTRK